MFRNKYNRPMKTVRVQVVKAASAYLSRCLEIPQLSQGRQRLCLSHTN